MRSAKTSPAGTELLRRSKDGLDVIQWRTFDGAISSARPNPALQHEAISTAAPIRVGSQHQNRPNQNGYHYWRKSHGHIWYESALELASLIELDFSGALATVTAQPFRILFRAGSQVVYHDPDFFGVGENGDQIVYDVKPRSRMSPGVLDQFAETRRVCEAVGWSHVVLNENSDTRRLNLEFLFGAAHRRCHPSPDVIEQARNVFAGGRSIDEGRSMLNRRYPALAMPTIRHLMWHHHLDCDLNDRLDFHTVATSTDGEANRCCG